MWRTRFLAGAAFLVLTACTTKPAENTFVAADTTADVASLKAAEDEWFRLYNQGDASQLAARYLDDAVLMAPGAAPAVGRPAIEAYYKEDMAATKAAGLVSNAGEITGTGVSGDLAWVTGVYTMTDAKGANVDTGKYLSLFKRTNGEWKYIRDTWNTDLAPAAAGSPPKV